MNLGNRIKNPEAIVLPPDFVLLKVFKKPTKILTVDESNPHNVDYIQIVRVGENVKNYKVGQIVLESDSFQQVVWETNGVMYIKTLANNLKLVIEESNLLPDTDEVKSNLLIN